MGGRIVARTKPRYEFVEGTSQKFWEIELEGAALPNAVLGEQRDNHGDEDERYVAVGE